MRHRIHCHLVVVTAALAISVTASPLLADIRPLLIGVIGALAKPRPKKKNPTSRTLTVKFHRRLR